MATPWGQHRQVAQLYRDIQAADMAVVACQRHRQEIQWAVILERLVRQRMDQLDLWHPWVEQVAMAPVHPLLDTEQQPDTALLLDTVHCPNRIPMVQMEAMMHTKNLHTPTVPRHDDIDGLVAHFQLLLYQSYYR
jgi:hypothetical protein